MAICEWCGKPHNAPGGCSPIAVEFEGVDYLPIPYGSESMWAEISEQPHGPCHDCGVMPGEYHHAYCDVEACPICGGQFLTCEHSSIDDGDEEDDD